MRQIIWGHTSPIFSCYPIVPMLRSKIVKAADFNVRSAVSHLKILKAHVSSAFSSFPFIWDGTSRCGLLLAGWSSPIMTIKKEADKKNGARCWFSSPRWPTSTLTSTMEHPALLATLTMSATMTMPPAGTPPTLPSDLFHAWYAFGQIFGPGLVLTPATLPWP